MKEMLLYGIGDLRMVESLSPRVDASEVLIEVRSCGVCPTDARKFRTGNHGLLRFPFNMGHEWAGDIVEVGENLRGQFEVGIRVHGSTYGGYAEYVKVGALRSEVDPMPGISLIFELPDGVSYEEATFAEPLADCIHAIKDQAQVSIGDWLVIVGSGQMGLQQIMVAQQMGANVIVTELLPERMELAKEFGANHVLDAGRGDVVEEVNEITEGGADAVILTIGQPYALEPALRMANTGGRIVLFGGFPHGSNVTFDPNIIHYNELKLIGSEWVGAVPHLHLEHYDLALALIAAQAVPVERLITHRYRLEDLEEALEAVGDNEALKAVVNFD